MLRISVEMKLIIITTSIRTPISTDRLHLKSHYFWWSLATTEEEAEIWHFRTQQIQQL